MMQSHMNRLALVTVAAVALAATAAATGILTSVEGPSPRVFVISSDPAGSYPNMTALVNASQVIVKARALGSPANAPREVTPGEFAPYTLQQFGVLQVLKGDVGTSVSIPMPGGQLGEDTYVDPNYPGFGEGSVSFLFLRPLPNGTLVNGTHQILGGPQGRLPSMEGHVTALSELHPHLAWLPSPIGKIREAEFVRMVASSGGNPE